MKPVEIKIASIACVFAGLGLLTWADAKGGGENLAASSLPPAPTPRAVPAGTEPVPTPKPRASATAVPRHEGLQVGDSGDAVVRWQKFLVSKGLYVGEITDAFDIGTRDETMLFQKENGLPEHGVVDARTMRAAREQGYKDSISTKTNESCCAGVSAEVTTEDYPETRTTLLAAKQPLSDDELQLALNEMYARHGLTFKDPDMQRHFCKRTWYKPDVGATEDDAELQMGQIELDNLKTMIAERASRRTRQRSREAER